jgi:hypothetical protein
VMSRTDFGGVLGELDHVLHHHPLRRGEGRLPVVGLKRSN